MIPRNEKHRTWKRSLLPTKAQFLFIPPLFIIGGFLLFTPPSPSPTPDPLQVPTPPTAAVETPTISPQDQMMQDIAVMNEQVLRAAEQKRVELEQLETAFYATAETAQTVMQAEWFVMPRVATPGDVLLVRHQQAAELSWFDNIYSLQPFGTGYFTYLPIPRDAEPGQYAVGDTFVEITAAQFETQQLTVSKQMEQMRRDTERIQADQQKVKEARSQSAARFLFTDEFIIPLEGRLSTPYGFTRFINGKLSGSHMAIDVAAPEGTPIVATNDGVVVLAEMLYLPGNSVYIDHGMHLFSQYAHLSDLNVKVGDEVEQGDVIGWVGSTGFSTGPHLHFAFWAHQVPVNPNFFFDTTPFRWSEQ
jgi:murein DD-endopeptidase MepM/ murein hydrolase activator NlpD